MQAAREANVSWGAGNEKYWKYTEVLYHEAGILRKNISVNPWEWGKYMAFVQEKITWRLLKQEKEWLSNAHMTHILNK